ncbi:hypothetical protein TWF730_003928 [Orbilia blumenaviensis]|uniref:Uncharacterized protein n=1 Tax=Orbilia blumenaviensis TaxID=1796055 RepID=A0AAV9U597_9PEZI
MPCKIHPALQPDMVGDLYAAAADESNIGVRIGQLILYWHDKEFLMNKIREYSSILDRLPGESLLERINNANHQNRQRKRKREHEEVGNIQDLENTKRIQITK